MPIYEYRCQSCGHELEKLQRLNDPVLTDCPECGKKKLRRLISAAGFRLKGAGWYETDFKQGNKRNLAESPTEGGEGAKSADKPATNGGAAKAESPGAKSESTGKVSSSSAAGASGDKSKSGGRAADPA